MKRIVLDAGKMTDPGALHAHLAQLLELPEYYGANLDALYDCLTELGEETEIVVPLQAADAQHLGSYGRQLLGVFKEAAEVNSCLRLEFRDGD